MPAALIWLLLGLVLLLLELAGAEFEGLMAAAIAALVVSALGGVLPLPLGLQLGLFAGLTALLLAGLQRWSRRRQRAITAGSGPERAIVISGFEGSDQGRVRWQGQSWAATNLEANRALPNGSEVVVMGRDGTRLQVLPPAAHP